jgi:hypothetical protein
MVTILPTFYEQLFLTKVKQGAFLYLQFRLKHFWFKGIGRKTTRKMLVKLTRGLLKINTK